MEAFLYTCALLVSTFQVVAVNTVPGYGLEDATSARQLDQELNQGRSLEAAAEKLVCDLPVPPGAFPPWITYKYLKAPAPLIYTEGKDAMGGQILLLRHAERLMNASMFGCQKEDSEWKARVLDPRANILTLELSKGAQNAVTSLCLLQDISLYRTHNQLALRLDYGYCPKPNTKTTQAFIMVGLQMVPNTEKFQDKTPGIKDFFEAVCGGAADKTAALDLNKAQAYHDMIKGYNANHCFVGSADTLKMQSAAQHPQCFTEATAYTWLTEDDEFGVLPITETDYAWLMNELPIKEPIVEPIRAYGQVTADRACVYLDGIKTRPGGPQCNNGCGKWCKPTEGKSADQIV